MVQSQVMQKIQLIEGKFTPSEASDLIGAFVEEKIKFHKLQRLCQAIHDETIDGQESRERIVELRQDRKTAKEFLAQARVKGRKVRMRATLEIVYED